MRVFMLGWEFPPFISGGLGTACYGLTKAMSGIGTDIMFVLPRPVSTPFSTHVRLVSPRPDSPLASPTTEFRLDEFDHVTFRGVDAAISNPYQTPADYDQEKAKAERDAAAKQATQQVAEVTKVRRATPVATAGLEPGTAAPAASPKDGATGATRGFIGNPGSANAHYGGDLFSE